MDFVSNDIFWYILGVSFFARISIDKASLQVYKKKKKMSIRYQNFMIRPSWQSWRPAHTYSNPKLTRKGQQTSSFEDANMPITRCFKLPEFFQQFWIPFTNKNINILTSICLYIASIHDCFIKFPVMNIFTSGYQAGATIDIAININNGTEIQLKTEEPPKPQVITSLNHIKDAEPGDLFSTWLEFNDGICKSNVKFKSRQSN